MNKQEETTADKTSIDLTASLRNPIWQVIILLILAGTLIIGGIVILQTDRLASNSVQDIAIFGRCRSGIGSLNGSESTYTR